ncbi:hypothetical protein [Bradyrhizobium sp. RDI18]|uniref:hypothetical protein n=1 Tax=Bradyrhizobium sp. RDI18 TaxID=3367400 RepID=UPI0037161852
MISVMPTTVSSAAAVIASLTRDPFHEAQQRIENILTYDHEDQEGTIIPKPRGKIIDPSMGLDCRHGEVRRQSDQRNGRDNLKQQRMGEP